MRFSLALWVIFSLTILPNLEAQKAEVLMVPLTTGGLSPLSKELTQRMLQELEKSGITVKFVPRSFPLPLSEEIRSRLIDDARNQNLAFLLVQGPDELEPLTIRHDLFRTFDSKLLASILVKGDSGRAALLRSVLLAKEIQNQLMELPPQTIINQNIQPLQPLALELPRPPQRLRLPEIGFNVLYGLPLGVASDYFSTALLGQLEVLWPWGSWKNFYWGSSVYYWQASASGKIQSLPMNFTLITGEISYGFSPHPAWEFFSSLHLGPGLLSFYPPSWSPWKYLSFKTGGQLVGVLDPGFPLVFSCWSFGMTLSL